MGTGLTARGWTMLAAGVAWCLVAFWIGQRDLWWPGMFLALLPLASLALLLPGSTLLKVRRRVIPRRVSAGEVAKVELNVDPGGISLGGLTRVRDQLPPALGESHWHGFPTGLGRWTLTVTYEVRPGWRGRHQIGPAERSVADGLGLALVRQLVPGTTELVVTPKVEPLANLRAASGLGMAVDTSLLRTGLGAADDVLVREYRQGDDVRRVHWRSTARVGELMVRREERAWDPSATVLVDNRARGYSGRVPDQRFEWAVSAAASIAVHLLADGFDLSLVEVDGSMVSPHRTGAGRESVVLERLTDLKLRRTRTLTDALATCGRGAEGQLLVAVLGRVDPVDAAALAGATRHGRACWALLVADDPELVLDQAESVRAAGWRCVAATPDTPVAAVWRELGEEPG